MRNLSIGDKIKELRKKSGLTQEQFADKLHVHEQTVSKWERGISLPDISLYASIALLLNVCVCELFSEPKNNGLKGEFSAEKLGKAIAYYRKNKGLTQSQLADMNAVSANAVSKWERGVIYPTVETLINLANYFNVEPSLLYYGVIPENNLNTAENTDNNVKRTSFPLKSIKTALIACVCIIAVLSFSLGYSLSGKIKPINAKKTAITKFEDLVDGSTVGTGNELYYNITYNCYSFHEGVDLFANEGSNVYAVEDGTVTRIYKDSYDSFIEIQHDNGYSSIYNFVNPLEDLFVGAKVKECQVIATVAEAWGREYKDGPHLHFEVYLNDQLMDPAVYFETNK